MFGPDCCKGYFLWILCCFLRSMCGIPSRGCLLLVFGKGNEVARVECLLFCGYVWHTDS